MNTTVYPSWNQCPRTSESSYSDVFSRRRPICQKCKFYGNTSDFRISKPCTICAMFNDGKWGWENGHVGEIEYLQGENGVLPGHCGVQDAIERNEIQGDRPRTLNEQVILGFVQYALYNHLKWKEILEMDLSGPNPLLTMTERMKEYQRRFCPEDTSDIEINAGIDNVWYWWKIIPEGTVLPKRLQNVLTMMLVSYEDKQYENCVPKTCQMLEGELSDNIWDDFLETYVEPCQVAHIYMLTLKKALEYDDEFESTHVNLKKNDELPRDIGSKDRNWVRMWNGESPRQWSPDEEETNYIFYKVISYDTSSLENEMLVKTKVVKLVDREIFGTYLKDVTDCDYMMERPWFRRPDIWYPTPNLLESGGEDRRRSGWENELWNPGIIFNIPGYEHVTIVQFLENEANKYLGFEDTKIWEDVQNRTNIYIDNEYENERKWRDWRQEIDEDEYWDDSVYEDGISDISYISDDELPPNENNNERNVNRVLDFGEEEIEYEPGEIEENNNTNTEKLKNVTGKLLEIQGFVDEKLREKLSEGDYLELVNKLLDAYRCVK